MSWQKLLFVPPILGCISLPLAADEKGELLKIKNVGDEITGDEALVQIAILLDGSGSMDGLINQARCQVWNVVSELSKASRGGKASKLEIAVYEYGGSKGKENGYVDQLVGFTEDLDEVSRALFSLVAERGPGQEYCGQAVLKALTDLNWSASPDVYKTVFIAGNEPFDQGPTTIERALSENKDGSIVLNSIYCFDPKYAEEFFKATDTQQWTAAAKLGGGMYFRIEHNHHLPEMKTPYDAKMRELNKRMNDTFVWYGDNAKKASENQQMQDRNAADMSDHAFAARMSAKIGHLYHHVHDELIDAISHGVVKLDEMPEDKMPEELKVMSPELRREFVERKIAQRNGSRRAMAEVISLRHAYLQRKMSEAIGEEGKAPQVLGDALVQAVRRQAKKRGFQFAEAQAGLASQTP